jgi:hypothetical protein
MSANTLPIFPIAPLNTAANLTAVTACATRAPILTSNLSTNNLVLLTPTSTNGTRIDNIHIQGSSSSITAATTAGLVQLWIYDGTTATLYTEIPVLAVTPSATSAAFNSNTSFTTLVLSPTQSLYVSSTVTTTVSTNALTVIANGGTY